MSKKGLTHSLHHEGDVYVVYYYYTMFTAASTTTTLCN